MILWYDQTKLLGMNDFLYTCYDNARVDTDDILPPHPHQILSNFRVVSGPLTSAAVHTYTYIYSYTYTVYSADTAKPQTEKLGNQEKRNCVCQVR